MFQAMPTHALALGAVLIGAGCAADDEPTSGSPSDGTAGGVAPAASAELTEQQRDDLRFMREEEKLARDVYLLNADSMRIFGNISQSEQRHMDAMLGLLQVYGVDDPVGDRAEGVFDNPQLQSLYDDLAGRSSESLVEALLVGAEIEEIDILDLQDALQSAAYSDIAQVYANLQAASENHLRAFTRNLAMRGVDYRPQHLSDAEYDAIIGAR